MLKNQNLTCKFELAKTIIIDPTWFFKYFVSEMVNLSLIFVFVVIGLLQSGSCLKNLEQQSRQSSMQSLIEESNYLSNFHSSVGKCHLILIQVLVPIT